MKILEQFIHFCIVCWTLAGIGAINSALNFPPQSYEGIFYFIFFLLLGIIGKYTTAVIYYDIRSYLSILLAIFFYLPNFLGLLYIKNFFFSVFILTLSILVINKLLSKNLLKWKNIFTFRFFFRSYFELKKVLKK